MRSTQTVHRSGRFLLGIEVGSSPAIGSDGTIYVGSPAGCCFAINPDGTLKWCVCYWAFHSTPPLLLALMVRSTWVHGPIIFTRSTQTVHRSGRSLVGKVYIYNPPLPLAPMVRSTWVHGNLIFTRIFTRSTQTAHRSGRFLLGISCAPPLPLAPMVRSTWVHRALIFTRSTVVPVAWQTPLGPCFAVICSILVMPVRKVLVRTATEMDMETLPILNAHILNLTAMTQTRIFTPRIQIPIAIVQNRFLRGRRRAKSLETVRTGSTTTATGNPMVPILDVKPNARTMTATATTMQPVVEMTATTPINEYIRRTRTLIVTAWTQLHKAPQR